jgi:hypothetical protein
MKPMLDGAGLSGLTGASCLISGDFDAGIHERNGQLGEVRAGMRISANAIHVQADFSVKDSVLAIGGRTAPYVFRLHDISEELQHFNLAKDPR